jgi:hypothetical protein
MTRSMRGDWFKCLNLHDDGDDALSRWTYDIPVCFALLWKHNSRRIGHIARVCMITKISGGSTYFL